MLSKKNDKKNVKSSLSPKKLINEEGSTCIISSGSQIDGKFDVTENVRLDGVIIGDMICQKRIMMGDTGKIEGSVIAEDMIVRGTIKGDIHVKNLLHLQETASIEGTIIAKSMIVDEGASYNGDCKVGSKGVSTPVPKMKAVKVDS